MATPLTLEITYDQLRREIGRYLGAGRSPSSDFDADDTTDVEDILASGLRKFYWPPPIENANSHTWSFLSPVSTLDIASGQEVYQLPEDFSGTISGAFCFAEDVENRQLSRASERGITALYARADRDGTPQYFALRTKQAEGRTRYELVLYPKPDASYTLSYRYPVEPGTIHEHNEKPLGGAVHAETILEACLAAAEEKLEDGGQEMHQKLFLERLATSIRIDRMNTSGEEDVWPDEHPAEDLGVNLAYLRRVVGRHMGYGPNSATWTHLQFKTVELVIENGLRKFYNPPVLPGQRYAHEWAFLRPVRPLVTQSSVSTYTLDDDFAMLDGPITFNAGSNTLWPAIEEIGEHQIRMRLQRYSTTGRPQICATRPTKPDKASGGKWELLLWPIPDGAYTLNIRMRIVPPLLAADEDRPYGHLRHANTILEACLCAADEMNEKSNGIHGNKFLECLMSSVGHDQKADSPGSLGYNRDPSDMEYAAYGDWHERDENIVTHNGNTY